MFGRRATSIYSSASNIRISKFSDGTSLSSVASINHYDSGENIVLKQISQYDNVILDNPGFAPNSTTINGINDINILNIYLPIPNIEGYKIQLFNNSSNNIQIISGANELIYNNFYCPKGNTSLCFPVNRNITLVYIKNNFQNSQNSQNTWYTIFS